MSTDDRIRQWLSVTAVDRAKRRGPAILVGAASDELSADGPLPGSAQWPCSFCAVPVWLLADGAKRAIACGPCSNRVVELEIARRERPI